MENKTIKKINFASDNYAGIHPKILQAIIAANADPAIAYGNDEYTEVARQQFKKIFGDNAETFFVFNGTGANVSAICALIKSYEAVICTDKAHIQVDECGAPEKLTGCKLLLVPAVQGKIRIENVVKHLQREGDQHAIQPRVISLSQSTEYGTVYTLEELRELAHFARSHGLYIHMDGARLANAAAHLQTDLKTIIEAANVDTLSFGGTKNGLMIGEAVVFFNPTLAKSFLFIRKQNMQLASKMRFISAQFEALLSNDVWLKNAQHANAMAQLLAQELAKTPAIRITHSVDANVVFAIMPKALIEKLQKRYYFYVWDESLSEVRLMASFNTSEEEIYGFIRDVRAEFA
ncbi:MAG: low specificity L-threonine aldolase [Gammaproteobacteria bacterium]|nr:low specificity L-threonine aldolase [Gammaproteobacteria bacterium]